MNNEGGVKRMVFEINFNEYIEGKQRYKLLKHLGEGGFANTYLGMETKSKVRVTIKVAKTKNKDVKEVEAMHRREAAFIDIQSGYSPDCVQLIESIEDPENERFIIVTNYVNGINFYDWLNSVLESPPPKYYAMLVENIFYPLAEFFSYIHQRGILHRVITPSNVLITKKEKGTILPVVIDWGTAINFDPAKYDESVPCLEETRECEDKTYYTPGYEPPEINLSKTCSARTDIYSFGVFMFYAFTKGQSRRRTRSKESYKLSPREITLKCPQMLSDIVERCTEYEPTNRFNTFGEIAIALQKYLKRAVGANFKKVVRPNKLIYFRKKAANKI